jgi:DnaJ family protein C protein 28
MNFRTVVERRIQDAWEKGKFRNLRGEGKPQDLEENPFEDPEMRLAHKVLSNAGFAPPWVELMKDIDRDTATAARVWEDYRAHRRRQMDAIHRGSVARFAELVAELDEARSRALGRLEKRWLEINQKISHLNAEVPSESLKRAPLDIEKRRRSFEHEFPLLGGMMRRP